jgi:hypothetical protein
MEPGDTVDQNFNSALQAGIRFFDVAGDFFDARMFSEVSIFVQ